MELMYFVIRHMEEASRAKRMRRRNDKIHKNGGTLADGHAGLSFKLVICIDVLCLIEYLTVVPASICLEFSTPRKVKKWEVLDLADSSPALDCIPARLLRESAASLLSSSVGHADPSLNSYEQSCEFLTRRLAPFLTKCLGRATVEPNSIIPVGSIAEALDIIITMQLKQNAFKSGGFVYVEERTQQWVCNVFLGRGLALRTLACDSRGLVVEDLMQQLTIINGDEREAAIAMGLPPAWPLFLYIQPSFNDPTGMCLSPDRRLELLQVTAATGLLVISDDTMSMLDFSSEMKSLDRVADEDNPARTSDDFLVPELRPLIDFTQFKHVLSVSSFSKIVSGEIAVGWIEINNHELLKILKGMVGEISGGSLSPFSACVIARCLIKDADGGGISEAFNATRLTDIYDYVCGMKKKFAKRCHHLTNALIRFSKLLLPPGPLNQLSVKGFVHGNGASSKFDIAESNNPDIVDGKILSTNIRCAEYNYES